MPPKKSEIAAQKHWIIGISVALVGVLISRIVCPLIEVGDVRFAVMILGHAFCLVGLLVIMRGVFRRHSEDDAED
ncbi:hypothetical protein [Candidatus Spyradosoma sp. SGI.093]|uniref:hypothetical protein n=1 Tax=Candidatus Spyradosoma sp. SGI.093 TaxID=3420583 RepID=UPI003CFC243A